MTDLASIVTNKIDSIGRYINESIARPACMTIFQVFDE